MKKYYTILFHVILILVFSCGISEPKEIKTIQIVNQSGLADAHAISSFRKQCAKHDVQVVFSENKEALKILIKGADNNESSNDIAEIYANFCNNYLNGSLSLNEEFENKFKIDLNEDDLNSSHQLVIVAAELDSSTERIIGYVDIAFR